MVDDLFEIDADGNALLRVHVQPGAGRTAVVGRHGDALKVRMAAPPERGRANDAVRTLLAEVLSIKEAQVELVSGESSRTKHLKVSGVEAADLDRLLGLALEPANGPGGGSPSSSRPTDRNPRRR